MEEIVREKTVCFTGHRGIAKAAAPILLSNLYSTVASLIKDGYDTFICGGAVGFDTLAVECVLEMRKRFPCLKVVLSLPCRDQTMKWSNTEALQRYKAALGSADRVHYITDYYTADCMRLRNRWMVDHSSVCVAYCNGRRPRSGTQSTVKYAEKSEIKVINIYPADDGVQCALEVD